MGFFPTVAVWEANFSKGVSLFIKVIFCGVFIVELPLFSWLVKEILTNRMVKIMVVEKKLCV